VPGGANLQAAVEEISFSQKSVTKTVMSVNACSRSQRRVCYCVLGGRDVSVMCLLLCPRWQRRVSYVSVIVS